MGNYRNEHIFKALKIAGDLMSLANKEDALRDNIGCGILSGVMRDCAYKIRQQVTRECRIYKAANDKGTKIS